MEPIDYRYKRTSEAIVRYLIEATLGIRFTEEDVEFGLPEVVEPLEPNLPVFPSVSLNGVTMVRDTRVLVKTRGDQYRMGRFYAVFARHDLAEIVPVSQNIIQVREFPFSTYDVLDQLNIRYGLSLSEDDVHDIYYPTLVGPFYLRAKSTCLAWKGQLEFEIEPLAIPLDDTLTVKDLEGFSASVA